MQDFQRKMKARVLSFNPKLKSEMEKYRESQFEIALVNCSVKKEVAISLLVSGEPKYEVVLSTKTRVEKSPKMFEMPDNLESINPCAVRMLHSLSQVDIVAKRHLLVLAIARSTWQLSSCQGVVEIVLLDWLSLVENRSIP